MRQNRAFCDQQYANMRQKEYDEALERESQLCRQLRVDYQRHAMQQIEQLHALIQEYLDAKHAKHTAMATEIVEQLVDMSLDVSMLQSTLILRWQIVHYKDVNEGKVPAKVMRELKALFFAGASLKKRYSVSIEQEKVTHFLAGDPDVAHEPQVDSVPEHDMELYRGIDQLDVSEFADYLDAQGTWSLAEG